MGLYQVIFELNTETNICANTEMNIYWFERLVKMKRLIIGRYRDELLLTALK